MDATTILLKAATLHRAGRLDEARALYRRVLGLNPNLAEAALFLGLAGLELGDFAEAEAAFARAAELVPDDPEARQGRGAALLGLGRPAEAEAEQRRATELAPDSAPAWDGLGSALLALGHANDAVSSYERALGLTPDAPGTLGNLAAALKTAGRPDEALARLDQALALRPGDADLLCNRANTHLETGDADAALADFTAAIAADPENVAARWGACFARLPVAFDRDEEIDVARAAYAEALDALDAWLGNDSVRLCRAAAQAAGNLQPFYLPYQGRNDKELQARYGGLLARVMAARHPDLATPPAPRRRAPGERIRVGVCTAYFHEHSVWKIPARGWLLLDKARFSVTGLHCGARQDDRTQEARALCDDFVHEPMSVERLALAARERELDVVLFPELGMDPLAIKAAALRLAPVQATGMGHPITSGLPTMDWYLSSADMEPPGGPDGTAQDWYTERLVLLPGLSYHYEPIERVPPPLGRADFGLPEDAVLFFSPQSLFKYLPRHDPLFPRIAEKIAAGGGRCAFVFLEHRKTARLTARFAERLARAFADAGLDPARYVFILPQQTPERFLALTGLCDVFLNSLGWSGLNTIMEAAAAGLPLITCPGENMRARHALALMRRLEMPEAVAGSMDDYITLAARLALDPASRAALAARVRENAPHLWRDESPIRALEDWLTEAVDRLIPH